MNDAEKRMTPEEALKLANKEKQRGKLKIFIGYAPGVGKSYTMLNESNRRLQRGEDIAIGYVELHGRPETEKQIGDIPVIPRKKIEYAGKVMEEMDTEAIIRRHPNTVLIDEIAHTNVPGSKNAKRYEDVKEVLDAGINVVTTLNVQHLESLNDIIKQITGVAVRETIPDSLVENADEVVAVDITVEALLNRLKRGDIYKKEKIGSALENFFREGNLTALREISLRQTAQEVDEELEDYMKAHGIDETWHTVERIMVCVSASPNSKKLIRRGALIARRYRCDWFVVAVENISIFTSKWGQKDRAELESNFKLAKQLGATTIHLRGQNISSELVKFAKAKHITQIVIGHSARTPFQSFFTGSTTGKLLGQTRDIAIHVIPTGGGLAGKGHPLLSWMFEPEAGLNDYWIIFVAVISIALAGSVVSPYIGYQSVGFFFLMAVLVLGLFVSAIPLVLFAILSALVWDLFFIPPIGTFNITNLNDLIMNITYVFASLISGYFIYRIRTEDRLLKIREARADTMYRIVSVIASAKDQHSCIESLEKEVEGMLPGRIKVFAIDDKINFDEVLRRHITDDEKELSVGVVAFEKGKAAGWSTDILSFAKAMYVPLKGPSATVGVLSFHPEDDGELSADEKSMLFAFADQLALYLEKELPSASRSPCRTPKNCV
jgi:two-component system sensor histidine kinase KdpD